MNDLLRERLQQITPDASDMVALDPAPDAKLNVSKCPGR
jgi:hypothetical protein